MRSAFANISVVLLLCLLAGCASRAPLTIEDLAASGKSRGFRPVLFDTGSFVLAGMLKGQPGDSDTLVVYLEGDGWVIRRGLVNSNPTPSRAQGYELALRDPAPLVLYLARIGQYQNQYSGRLYQTYWTDKRLGVEAVVATDRALTQARERTGASWLHLAGYSGGGGLATLTAQNRKDVASLVTVAGLLDTVWWVTDGGYRPLTGLNPADGASLLADLPQIHFYGDEDGIIPPALSGHFAASAGFTALRRVAVRGDHWDPWTKAWPGLLASYVLPMRRAAERELRKSTAVRFLSDVLQTLPLRDLWFIFPT